MSAEGSNPRYDLEARTEEFARDVRAFFKLLPRTIPNAEDVRQLARCSASIGANYIEANEALSKKDRVVRMRISRKEAKEARFFLRIIDVGTTREAQTHRDALVQEATELMQILSSIILKLE